MTRRAPLPAPPVGPAQHVALVTGATHAGALAGCRDCAEVAAAIVPPPRLPAGHRLVVSGRGGPRIVVTGAVSIDGSGILVVPRGTEAGR